MSGSSHPRDSREEKRRSDFLPLWAGPGSELIVPTDENKKKSNEIRKLERDDVHILGCVEDKPAQGQHLAAIHEIIRVNKRQGALNREHVCGDWQP